MLQRFRVLEACRADINAEHMRARVTQRKLNGLPRSTSGYEEIEIRPVLLVRPVEMVFCAMDVFVLPHLARTIEVVNRRGIRMTRVELADWITHFERVYLQAPFCG